VNLCTNRRLRAGIARARAPVSITETQAANLVLMRAAYQCVPVGEPLPGAAP
jgi:hypothetical protein